MQTVTRYTPNITHRPRSSQRAAKRYAGIGGMSKRIATKRIVMLGVPPAEFYPIYGEFVTSSRSLLPLPELIVRRVLAATHSANEGAVAVGGVARTDERAAVHRAVRVAVERQNLRHTHLPGLDVVIREWKFVRNRPLELRVRLLVHLPALRHVVGREPGVLALSFALHRHR